MTNPKKTIKPIMPAKPAAMTEEEKKAAIIRGFSQQFQGIAQGALFNLLQSDGYNGQPATVVSYALNIASEYMLQSGPALNEAIEKFAKVQEEK